MAGPLLFLLPGFGGSNLATVEGNGALKLLWPNVGRLAIPGGIELLQLDADGVDPGPLARGVLVEAKGLVPGYYDSLVSRLEASFTVKLLPYDWRKSITEQGDLVWDRIKATAGGADYYIVAHSLGGLLARWVWFRAGQAGTQARIKRIVTIATPHWGTYSAPRTFGRLDQWFQQIWVTTFPIRNPTVPQVALSMATGRTADYLDRVLATWPALYELFPNPGETGFITDDLRPELFKVANWAPINDRVTQEQLTGAREVQGQLLLAQPPDSVLLCVAGRGIGTPAELRPPLRLEAQAGYNLLDGDGRVPLSSAALRIQREVVTGEHALLPQHRGILDLIGGWLLNGFAPVPDAEQWGGEVPPLFEGVVAVPGLWPPPPPPPLVTIDYVPPPGPIKRLFDP